MSPEVEEGPVRGTASGTSVREGPGLRGPWPAQAGAGRTREALCRRTGIRGRGKEVGAVRCGNDIDGGTWKTIAGQPTDDYARPHVGVYLLSLHHGDILTWQLKRTYLFC